MKQNRSAFKSFCWNFFSYLKGPGKSTVLTILFYSLWIVVDRLTYAKFDLHSFDNRPIGSATFESYDIGARVSLYYSCLFFFFLAFLGFNLLAYFIHGKIGSIFKSPEMRLLNYTSLAGLSLLIFPVFEIRIFETLELVYFLHKFFLLGLLLKLLFRKNSLNIYHYAIVLSLSCALYFLIADLNNLMGYALNPDFYITTFLIAFTLLLFLQIGLRLTSNYSAITRLAYVLVPLAALPLFSILKDEIFLVLKANGQSPNGQGLIYLTLLGFSFLLLLWRARKKTFLNLKDSLAKGYFPVLLFSLVSYTLYAYCAEYYDELFESGNVYLPLMENHLFGVVPTLEKLNTHLLSDYFLNAVYVMFNGLKMHEIVLYEFFVVSFSFLLFYYVVFYLSRNEFVAFFAMFLFPFAEAMAPAGSFMAVLGIFALKRLCLGTNRFKDYLFFAATLLLLIIWRIDLAFACAVALPASLLYFHARDKNFSVNWRHLVWSHVLVASSATLLVGALSLYRSINFFSKISYFLHYSMSAQSYGLKTMGWSNLPSYKMHYFVFPVLVAITSIILIVNYKPLSKRYKLAYISLIYLCLFYFVSFNRGIIRHSLLESTDAFTSTVIYCILPGSVFFVFRKQSQALKFALFIAVGFFLIINYRVPAPQQMKSPAEQLIVKLKTNKNINLARLKSRVLPPVTGASAEKEDFVSFINTHTKADETYIDFSNRPMYHFFTQKETPAWFYQNPLCVRDDYLQDRFVEDLSHYKTPYLIFNGLTDQFYENVDQVPNQVRHYRMAEYFYQHYSPYIIVDGLCLWRRNDVRATNLLDTIYRSRPIQNKLLRPLTVSARITYQATKKYLVKMNFSRRPQNLAVKAFFKTKTVKGSCYLINDTVAYCILKPGKITAKSFILECTDQEKLITQLEVIQCQNIPDFTAEHFQNYSLKQLPHVWGTYDKTLAQEPLLFAISKGVHKEGSLPSIVFPKDLDKSSGNTLVVYCLNTNKDVRYLNLSFGPETGHFFTTLGFEALPLGQPQKYAFRVSSNYKWYSEANCRAFIWATNGDMTGIRVTKMEITKGK